MKFLHLLTLINFFYGASLLASTHEFFNQTVNLSKYKNIVNQGFYHYNQDKLYGGFYFDFDQKTGEKVVYTDSQVSPLLGIKSDLFFQKYLPSRAFSEGRLVFRTTDFSDGRDKNSWDLRFGLLGYDMISKPYFFLEHYYTLMYTRLYNDRLIFQGWSKQGFHLTTMLDLFNEVFYDTFDLTRDNDGTFDLRPGLRASIKKENLTFQLLHQYVYHFSNLAFSGRDEHRTTLVIAGSF